MTIHRTLAQPGRIGTLQLQNRFVMAPMTRASSPGRVPTQEVAEYYARRARGGVGLIITEGVLVPDDANVAPDGVPVLSRETVDAWRRVVDAVHDEGSRIFPQLWHLGAYDGADGPDELRSGGVGPSGLDGNGKDFGRALTAEDADRIIKAFVESAKAALDSGFDGIELHGAHGFLFDQFLWPATNKRDDRYGISESRGTALIVDVIRSIREVVGPDFPIIVRLSQWKIGYYESQIAQNMDELAAITLPIKEAGVDGFHVSARRYWQPSFSGPRSTLSGQIRELTGLPTITVGSLGLADSDFESAFQGQSAKSAEITRAIELFESSEFDFIALGRALVSEPDWVKKTLNGQHEEVRDFDPSDLASLH